MASLPASVAVWLRSASPLIEAPSQRVEAGVLTGRGRRPSWLGPASQLVGGGDKVALTALFTTRVCVSAQGPLSLALVR
jgi:hypothetical protein